MSEKSEIELILESGIPNFTINDSEAAAGLSTFKNDHSLPPLPLPRLEDTLQLYLETLAPLANSEQELRHVEFIVNEFLVNEGPLLQKYLEKRASNHLNWVNDWWYEFAYLRNRTPSLPNCSMIGPSPYAMNCWPAASGTQIERAAILLHLHGSYWKFLRHSRIRPDTRVNGDALSMDQFMRLYNSAKIPGVEVDRLEHYFRIEEHGSVPCHVLVGCGGRFFFFDILRRDTGELLEPPHFEEQLRRIKVICDCKEAGDGLGYFSASERSQWAKTRFHLEELSSVNKDSLKMIDTAILVLTLLDDEPQDGDELIRSTFLARDISGYWADKSLNMIVTANGLVSNVVDHAPMDAMTLVASTFYFDTQLAQWHGKWPGSRHVNCATLPHPIEVQWVLDKEVDKALLEARNRWSESRMSVGVSSRTFSDFGKTRLRKLGLHPDTVVQLALQLAYVRLYGRGAPTYETATTRRFFHGRTETLRSCTREALNWARLMINAGQHPRGTDEHVYNAFCVAHRRHNELRERCEAAQGCDRHLLGLDLAARELGHSRPALFQHPLWKRSGGDGNFILSTSFLGYATVIGFVSPMCPRGYGCFYRTGLQRIQMMLTWWRADEPQESAERLWPAVQQALRDIEALCSAHKASAHKARL